MRGAGRKVVLKAGARRRLCGAMAAVVALVALAVALPAADHSAVPVAAAQAPGAPGPARVYVVVLDGLRPHEVGSLTPTLSQLRAQGTWYEQARAVFPAETLPNHVAMMTGKLPRDNGVIANQWWPSDSELTKAYMDRSRHYLEAETVVSRLEKACTGRGDVATATVQSKTYLDKIFKGEPAQAGDAAAQREADFHWRPSPLIPQSDHAPDQFTMDAFLGWMGRQPATLPQFAYINLGDIDRSGHADQSGAVTAGGLTAARQGALSDTDQQVKRLVDDLKARGAWDETVLLFASDHGMDWGTQDKHIDIKTALEPRFNGGYAGSDRFQRDFLLVDGGGSGLVYVHRKADIAPIARRISEMEGVAFVAARERIPGLNNPTLAEMGIDHPASPDIEVFAKPGYRAATYGVNPLPGNHGHPVTQHSTLFAAGGHPALADEPKSVAGPLVYDASVPEGRRFSDPTGGPGNLSIAPTVAALFGLGDPEGGYAVEPLADAFGAGVLKRSEPLCGDAAAPQLPPATALDEPPPAAQAPGPLLTASAEVERADARQATYELVAYNHGGATVEDVTLRANVPQNVVFDRSDPSPTATPACPKGAAPAAECAWTLGDIPAGESRTVRATYDLAQIDSSYEVPLTASVAAPGQPGASDTDRSLRRRSEVLSRDAFVQAAGDEDLNHGACDVLSVGRDGTATTLLMSRLPAGLAREPVRRVERLFSVELTAKVKQSPYTAANPGKFAVHRTAVERWDEGSGSCVGQTGQGDELRRARKPGAGSQPVAGARVEDGGLLRFDVTEALDSAAERVEFSGFELRDGGSPATGDGLVTLGSREGSEADRPRVVAVYTLKANADRCIDVDAETVTRPSDRQPRLVAEVTDGRQVVSVSGGDACNGVPLAGQSIIWEVDREGPDVYFSNLAGTPWAKEPKTGGSMGPNRAVTLTDNDGRTFVGVRQDRPYEQGTNTGENRIAGILEYPQLEKSDEGDGAEPENCPAGAECSGEEPSVEDDVRVVWTAAPPPPPDGDGDGVPDASDDCPAQAGPSSNKGCPVSPPPDRDGDGVPDATDKCPGEAGPASGDGCPIKTSDDADGDGVADGSDDCPNQAGPVTSKGCPVNQSDATTTSKAATGAGSSTSTGGADQPRRDAGAAASRRPAAPRAILTRRVERGRLRLRCALRGATARSCVVNVLARRRGRLRLIRTVRVGPAQAASIRLPRVLRLVLRATVVGTNGDTHRTTRTLTRTK